MELHWSDQQTLEGRKCLQTEVFLQGEISQTGEHSYVHWLPQNPVLLLPAEQAAFPVYSISS
jgi:hypothetical protein